MSLSSDGGLSLQMMLGENSGDMTGKRSRATDVSPGPGMAGAFNGASYASTVPAFMAGQSELNFDVDKKPAQAEAEKPRQTLLQSIGISFKLPSNVASMDRDGSKAITDLGKNTDTLNAAKTDMAQQRNQAEARFDDMKGAAVTLAVSAAVKDGLSPGAYIPPGRDSDNLQANFIGAAVAAKVGGPVMPVLAAAQNVGEAAKEVTPSPVTPARRSAAWRKIEAEIVARASRSEAQIAQDRAKVAGSPGMSGQDALRREQRAPGELDESFYKTQGYKDLEKAVLAGHGLDSIMTAKFDEQPEVQALDHVDHKADEVLDHYTRLRQGDGVQINPETVAAAIERGGGAVVVAAPQPADPGDILERVAESAGWQDSIRIPNVPRLDVAGGIRALGLKPETPAIQPGGGLEQIAEQLNRGALKINPMAMIS